MWVKFASGIGTGGGYLNTDEVGYFSVETDGSGGFQIYADGGAVLTDGYSTVAAAQAALATFMEQLGFLAAP